MRAKAHHLWLNALLGFGLAEACNPGIDGAAIAEECLEVAPDICNVGESANVETEAFEACEGQAGANIRDQSGEIRGRCVSAGKCTIFCERNDDFCKCGVASYTEDEIVCRQDCPASQTTDGEPTTGDTGPADTNAGESSGGCSGVGLVGEWLSEGENVAPLLVDVLNLVSIQASFDETTFEVNSTDADGAVGQQLGTWTSELCPGSETKYRIVLEQTAPSAITAEGIYEIDGCMNSAVMRYEVIQTQPDIGALEPTCDDDFGIGQFGADNIQIFLRAYPSSAERV